MNFSHEIIEYLNDDKFIDYLEVKICSPEREIPLRIDYIESLAKGKKIIHVGCVDHLPIIKQRIQENTWLHKRLDECATRCLGIDLSKEGIEFIKAEYGYTDVLCFDLVKDDVSEIIRNEKWDYMVLGEVLEHIDDPVAFLAAISNKYSAYVDRLIITVPNAFAMQNFKNLLKSAEFINSDHRYWFTPYTLAKVVTRAGMYVESFQFCHSHKPARQNPIGKFLSKRFPAFRDRLLMVAKTRNKM